MTKVTPETVLVMMVEVTLPDGSFVKLDTSKPEYLIRAQDGTFYRGHRVLKWGQFSHIMWEEADVPANYIANVNVERSYDSADAIEIIQAALIVIARHAPYKVWEDFRSIRSFIDFYAERMSVERMPETSVDLADYIDHWERKG